MTEQPAPRFEVLIKAPAMRRMVGASSDRSLALLAERLIRTSYSHGTADAFSVVGPDPEAIRRIADYVHGVLTERHTLSSCARRV